MCGATFDIDAEDVEKASAQDKFAGEPNQISIMNKRVFPAETDRVAQEAERFRGEDEVNKEKMERQSQQLATTRRVQGVA